MTPSEPILRVSGLGKRYRLYRRPGDRVMEWLTGGRVVRHREHWALRDASFELARGDVCGVIGRNGAGKSTLLAVLAGTLRPTEGEIRGPASVSALLNLGAGFDPEESGIENLRRLGELVDGRPFDQEEMGAIADFAEIGDAIARPVRTYSSGMQLRLGFAAATQRRPDLLLVDEILAVGDYFFRRKCHERIAGMVHQGTAMLIVSHNHDEIVHWCSRALTLHEGAVICLGSPQDAVRAFHQSQRSRNPAHMRAGAERPEGSGFRCGGAPVAWPDGLPMPARERNDGTYRWTGLKIADAGGDGTAVFAQSQEAHVLVEIECLSDLRAPVFSLMIQDHRGETVYGSCTLFGNLEMPERALTGDILQVSFAVDLGLQCGEYGLYVAFGDIDPAVARARSGLAWDEVSSAIAWRGRADPDGCIAIVPDTGRAGARLSHFGVADLRARIGWRSRGEPTAAASARGA